MCMYVCIFSLGPKNFFQYSKLREIGGNFSGFRPAYIAVAQRLVPTPSTVLSAILTTSLRTSASDDPPERMSSEDDSCSGDTPPDAIIEDCDDETLRIMLSTDNHLGYLEDDPVRGDDSFAALEEVLFLARKHSCDMVLLAGDLFHENKPSRLTLFKSMNIFRRYCMGKNAVSIQILSDQKKNFRRGVVNYQDEFYSVDLPVMSIHGNHDSPANEGAQGSHLLAALDLLDSANLVNYIGQQGNNKEVEVSPVLIKKGNTQVALYGLGSMREERLNRLWQTAKFSFLRPAETHEGADDDAQWFNLFALHQNRNRGRGSKNCVHESMIPEWMDLVIWGHEHECLIEVSLRDPTWSR
jgi:double-strand break repair protein MRE11